MQKSLLSRLELQLKFRELFQNLSERDSVLLQFIEQKGLLNELEAELPALKEQSKKHSNSLPKAELFVSDLQLLTSEAFQVLVNRAYRFAAENPVLIETHVDSSSQECRNLFFTKTVLATMLREIENEFSPLVDLNKNKQQLKDVRKAFLRKNS